MRTNGLAALVAAALLASSGLLVAQDSDGEGIKPANEEPAEQASAESPAEESSTAEAAQTPRRDPFDYESSEQISEDLSVSFPVDI